MANSKKVVVVAGNVNATRAVKVTTPVNAVHVAGVSSGNAEKIKLITGAPNAVKVYFTSGAP